MSKESALAALTQTSSSDTSVSPIVSPPSGEMPAPGPTSPGAGPSNPELKSTAFNHLAKKEADLFRQKQEFKKQQEVFQADAAIIADAKRQYESWQEKRKSDPITALKELGFSETDVFNYMANQQPIELTPEQKIVQAAEQAAEAKLKAFEEGQVKKLEAIENDRNNKVIQEYKSDLSKIIKSDPEKFEYCNYYGKMAEDIAFEVARIVMNKSNGEDILLGTEAMEMVEEFYENQDKEMSSFKKRQPKAIEQPKPEEKTEPVRTRTLANQASPPSTQNKTANQSTSSSRTLHNGVTSTVASTRQIQNESRTEKRERLMQALRDGRMP